MITLLIAYDDCCEKFFSKLSLVIKDKYPDIEFAGYNENFLKERKKAFGLKGKYAARKLPFAAISTDEDKSLKAFYSEVFECTIDNITNALDYYLSIQEQDENGENTSN